MNEKKRFVILLIFLFIFLMILFYLNKQKKDIDPTADWKTINELKYTIKYPPKWFYSSDKEGGIKYISNFKTDTCADEKGNPINVLVDNICVSITTTEQVSGAEDFPLEKYLNRQFGVYNSQSKTYETPMFENLILSNGRATSILANNSLNYLFQRGNLIIQISMVPGNSSLQDQFKLLASTLNFGD